MGHGHAHDGGVPIRTHRTLSYEWSPEVLPAVQCTEAAIPWIQFGRYGVATHLCSLVPLPPLIPCLATPGSVTSKVMDDGMDCAHPAALLLGLVWCVLVTQPACWLVACVRVHGVCCSVSRVLPLYSCHRTNDVWRNPEWKEHLRAIVRSVAIPNHTPSAPSTQLQVHGATIHCQPCPETLSVSCHFPCYIPLQSVYTSLLNAEVWKSVIPTCRITFNPSNHLPTSLAVSQTFLHLFHLSIDAFVQLIRRQSALGYVFPCETAGHLRPRCAISLELSTDF